MINFVEKELSNSKPNAFQTWWKNIAWPGLKKAGSDFRTTIGNLAGLAEMALQRLAGRQVSPLARIIIFSGVTLAVGGLLFWVFGAPVMGMLGGIGQWFGGLFGKIGTLNAITPLPVKVAVPVGAGVVGLALKYPWVRTVLTAIPRGVFWGVKNIFSIGKGIGPFMQRSGSWLLPLLPTAVLAFIVFPQFSLPISAGIVVGYYILNYFIATKPEIFLGTKNKLLIPFNATPGTHPLWFGVTRLILSGLTISFPPIGFLALYDFSRLFLHPRRFFTFTTGLLGKLFWIPVYTVVFAVIGFQLILVSPQMIQNGFNLGQTNRPPLEASIRNQVQLGVDYAQERDVPVPEWLNFFFGTSSLPPALRATGQPEEQASISEAEVVQQGKSKDVFPEGVYPYTDREGYEPGGNHLYGDTVFDELQKTAQNAFRGIPLKNNDLFEFFETIDGMKTIINGFVSIENDQVWVQLYQVDGTQLDKKPLDASFPYGNSGVTVNGKIAYFALQRAIETGAAEQPAAQLSAAPVSMPVLLPPAVYAQELESKDFQLYNNQAYLPLFAQVAELLEPGDSEFSYIAQAIYNTERGAVLDAKTNAGLGGINDQWVTSNGLSYPSGNGPVHTALYRLDDLRPSDELLMGATAFIRINPGNDARAAIFNSYHHPDTNIAARTQAFISTLILHQSKEQFGPWLAPLGYNNPRLARDFIAQFVSAAGSEEEALRIANEILADLYRVRYGVAGQYGYEFSNLQGLSGENTNEYGGDYIGTSVSGIVTVNGSPVQFGLPAVQYLFNLPGDARMGFFDRFNKLYYDAGGVTGQQSVVPQLASDVVYLDPDSAKGQLGDVVNYGTVEPKDLQTPCPLCLTDQSGNPMKYVVPQSVFIHVAGNSNGSADSVFDSFIVGRDIEEIDPATGQKIHLNPSVNLIVGRDGSRLQIAGTIFKNGIRRTKGATFLPERNNGFHFELAGVLEDFSADPAVMNSLQVVSLIDAVVQAMNDFNIPMSEVMGHSEIPGSTNPDPSIEFMDALRAKIQERLDAQSSLSAPVQTLASLAGDAGLIAPVTTLQANQSLTGAQSSLLPSLWGKDALKLQKIMNTYPNYGIQRMGDWIDTQAKKDLDLYKNLSRNDRYLDMIGHLNKNDALRKGQPSQCLGYAYLLSAVTTDVPIPDIRSTIALSNARQIFPENVESGSFAPRTSRDSGLGYLAIHLDSSDPSWSTQQVRKGQFGIRLDSPQAAGHVFAIVDVLSDTSGQPLFVVSEANLNNNGIVQTIVLSPSQFAARYGGWSNIGLVEAYGYPANMARSSAPVVSAALLSLQSVIDVAEGLIVNVKNRVAPKKQVQPVTPTTTTPAPEPNAIALDSESYKQENPETYVRLETLASTAVVNIRGIPEKQTKHIIQTVYVHDPSDENQWIKFVFVKPKGRYNGNGAEASWIIIPSKYILQELRKIQSTYYDETSIYDYEVEELPQIAIEGQDGSFAAISVPDRFLPVQTANVSHVDTYTREEGEIVTEQQTPVLPIEPVQTTTKPGIPVPPPSQLPKLPEMSSGEPIPEVQLPLTREQQQEKMVQELNISRLPNAVIEEARKRVIDPGYGKQLVIPDSIIPKKIIDEQGNSVSPTQVKSDLLPYTPPFSEEYNAFSLPWLLANGYEVVLRYDAKSMGSVNAVGSVFGDLHLRIITSGVLDVIGQDPDKEKFTIVRAGEFGDEHVVLKKRTPNTVLTPEHKKDFTSRVVSAVGLIGRNLFKEETAIVYRPVGINIIEGPTHAAEYTPERFSPQDIEKRKKALYDNISSNLVKTLLDSLVDETLTDNDRIDAILMIESLFYDKLLVDEIATLRATLQKKYPELSEDHPIHVYKDRLDMIDALSESGQEYVFMSVDAPGKTKADNTSGDYELGNNGIRDQFYAIADALAKQGFPIIVMRRGGQFYLAIPKSMIGTQSLGTLISGIRTDVLAYQGRKTDPPVLLTVEAVPLYVVLGERELNVLALDTAQNQLDTLLWNDTVDQLNVIVSNAETQRQDWWFLANYYLNPFDKRGVQHLLHLGLTEKHINDLKPYYMRQEGTDVRILMPDNEVERRYKEALQQLLTSPPSLFERVRNWMSLMVQRLTNRQDQTIPQGIEVFNPNDLPENVKVALRAITLNPDDIRTVTVSVQANGMKDYAITMKDGSKWGFDENGEPFAGGVPAPGVQIPQPETPTNIWTRFTDWWAGVMGEKGNISVPTEQQPTSEFAISLDDYIVQNDAGFSDQTRLSEEERLWIFHGTKQSGVQGLLRGFFSPRTTYKVFTERLDRALTSRTGLGNSLVSDGTVTLWNPPRSLVVSRNVFDFGISNPIPENVVPPDNLLSNNARSAFTQYLPADYFAYTITFTNEQIQAFESIEKILANATQATLPVQIKTFDDYIEYLISFIPSPSMIQINQSGIEEGIVVPDIQRVLKVALIKMYEARLKTIAFNVLGSFADVLVLETYPTFEIPAYEQYKTDVLSEYNRKVLANQPILEVVQQPVDETNLSLDPLQDQWPQNQTSVVTEPVQPEQQTQTTQSQLQAAIANAIPAARQKQSGLFTQGNVEWLVDFILKSDSYTKYLSDISPPPITEQLSSILTILRDTHSINPPPTITIVDKTYIIGIDTNGKITVYPQITGGSGESAELSLFQKYRTDHGLEKNAIWTDDRVHVASQGIVLYKNVYAKVSESLQAVLRVPEIMQLFTGVRPTMRIATYYPNLKYPNSYEYGITENDIEELKNILLTETLGKIQIVSVNYKDVKYKDGQIAIELMNEDALRIVVSENPDLFPKNILSVIDYLSANPQVWPGFPSGNNVESAQNEIRYGVLSGFPRSASEVYAFNNTAKVDYIKTFIKGMGILFHFVFQRADTTNDADVIVRMNEETLPKEIKTDEINLRKIKSRII
jgi:hypothetical protein